MPISRYALGTLGLVVVMVAALTFWYVEGVTRATVQQSDGWLEISSASADRTLSGTFPVSATRFRFAHSSVGMGGRFSAYAVDGDPNDLEKFAAAEFAAHWDKLKLAVAPDELSPFDEEQVAFLEKAYSVRLEWLRDSHSGRGTIYTDIEGGGSRPTIFVDRQNAVLYSVMSD